MIGYYGKVLCDKHYKQIKKYGHVLDDNPRTILDRNEIHVWGDSAYIDLYDKNCNVVAQAIIDTEDIPKVRYTKWKLSASGYVMNSPKYSGGNKHLSRVILGTDQFVDHRNHDPLNNRKRNLRITTKSTNQMNANYKGISERKNGKYEAHIKINGKMLNLGVYVDKDEAYWARWYGEQVLFKEFRFPKPEPFILDARKSQIKDYVDRKVQRL